MRRDNTGKHLALIELFVGLAIIATFVNLLTPRTKRIPEINCHGDCGKREFDQPDHDELRFITESSSMFQRQIRQPVGVFACFLPSFTATLNSSIRAVDFVWILCKGKNYLPHTFILCAIVLGVIPLAIGTFVLLPGHPFGDDEVYKDLRMGLNYCLRKVHETEAYINLINLIQDNLRAPSGAGTFSMQVAGLTDKRNRNLSDCVHGECGSLEERDKHWVNHYLLSLAIVYYESGYPSVAETLAKQAEDNGRRF